MKKALILQNLRNKILEMNNGFAFVAQKERIVTQNNGIKYIDLVFYNRILKGFVLVSLTKRNVNPQDNADLQIRMQHYDNFVVKESENKTIGIIFCKDKSKTLVEITLPQDNDQIFASRYHTVLPDKQAFINLLNEGEL